MPLIKFSKEFSKLPSFHHYFFGCDQGQLTMLDAHHNVRNLN